jgi:hypothetical protein
MKEFVFLTSTKFIIFSCSTMYLLFLCFFDPFSLGANYRQDVLHVTYYIISSIFFGWNSSLSRLFQLVMSCHWHMNMCCPIKLHVDMITLFKKLLTQNCMSMQKVRLEKYFSHLACGNNHDGVYLMLCMVLNLVFTCFLTSEIINCINLWFFTIM